MPAQVGIQENEEVEDAVGVRLVGGYWIARSSRAMTNAKNGAIAVTTKTQGHPILALGCENLEEMPC